MRCVMILAVLLLTACKPSFDDRYNKAEKNIRTEASGVDSELAKQPSGTPSPSRDPSALPSASEDPPAE